MFRLNFKIALRNLWKNKGYAFINIAGLSVAMASCILIFIFIRYQLSYDDFENKDRIYRVVSNWDTGSSTEGSQGVPVPLVSAVRAKFPQLEKVAAIKRVGGIIKVADLSGKTNFKEETEVFYAEPELFAIFKLKWLTEMPSAALQEPNTVALSRKKAVLYFGTWTSAVGKIIRFKDKMDLKVSGVFDDIPDNSSYPFNLMVSYATNPNKNDGNWSYVSSASECYILLKKGVRPADLEAGMKKFSAQVYKKEEHTYHSIQALSDVHYNDHYGNFAHDIMEKKDIYGLSVIGVFLLLTACINFINLATAQAIGRSKEVGIRKVMGSDRKQLVVQFLGETLAISIIAMLFACALTEVALPYMQHLFDEKISFSLFSHPVIFVFLITLVLLVSFLAGFYPALIMSGFSPALAIKNKLTASNTGGLGLRKILVVVQFTVTVVLVISTLVVMNQMSYMRQKPLGYNPDAVSLVTLPGDSLSQLKAANLKERLLLIPGVKNISFCKDGPSSYNVYETEFSLNGLKNKDFQVRIMYADERYFDVFGLKMVAGKPLAKSDTVNGYVVNETFLTKLNITDPETALGKLLDMNGSKAPIVGVTKDFNDLSLREKISPIAIASGKDDYYSIAIKMESRQMMPAMKAVEALWNTAFPDHVYDSKFINNEISGYYSTEKVMGVLFRTFSMVIIFIAFTGLFGLISFVAAQRTREVAIRKVLGASTLELVQLLNGSFLLMVFIANLIAWPLAYVFVGKWLDGYAYRITLGIWPFAIAMLISMGITLITVSLRSYKAAQTNPVDALKYE